MPRSPQPFLIAKRKQNPYHGYEGQKEPGVAVEGQALLRSPSDSGGAGAGRQTSLAQRPAQAT